MRNQNSVSDTIGIGRWVRIRKEAHLPHPMVIKNYPQRVKSIAQDKLILERWILRFEDWVEISDIPISDVELIPRDDEPKDYCLHIESSKRGSAIESFKRGRCLICRFKNKCDWWKERYDKIS